MGGDWETRRTNASQAHVMSLQAPSIFPILVYMTLQGAFSELTFQLSGKNFRREVFAGGPPRAALARVEAAAGLRDSGPSVRGPDRERPKACFGGGGGGSGRGWLQWRTGIQPLSFGRFM